MTIAQKISKMMGNDGQAFVALNGRSFRSVLRDYTVKIEYGGRSLNANGIDLDHEAVTCSEYFAGDPIRYEFDDRSAIVEAGDAWDIEGKKPFSWKSLD